MNLETIVNSIGLILSVIGVWLVWKGSPINYHIESGGINDSLSEEGQRVNRKNANIRYGVYFIIIGTILQLVSNFIPLCDGKNL